MDPKNFERLTGSERAVLRELLVHGHQASVAKAMNLSPETVKTHLRNAREKCGASASFALARRLAEHERSTPNGGMPLFGVGTSGIGIGDLLAAEPDGTPESTTEVREDRMAFGHRGAPSQGRNAYEEVRGEDRALRRLLVGAGIMLAITVAMILAFPLSESFQRLADRIDPPRH